MTQSRTAILFDAENINCETAARALQALSNIGPIQIKRAVGDFSLSALSNWIGFSRSHGIELILQPSTGKGKNGADIRLTIEAMDIVNRGKVETLGIVSHDGDFAPLALRLRNSGITVVGFSRTEPNPAFRASCSSFQVVGPTPVVVAEVAKPLVARPAVPPTSASGIQLSSSDIAKLRQVIGAVCQAGPVHPHELSKAVLAADADLIARLRGKFLKTLVARGLAQRVGSGTEVRVTVPKLRSVS